LRVHRQAQSAAQIAAFLETHRAVERVLYPGLESHPQHALARRQMSGGSTLLAFSVADGKGGAFRFQNALRLIEISNNLGDSKSLVTHPATTTHHRLKPEERASLGIDDGLVRLSVGLEDPADLIQDLDQALRQAN
jgi:O-succinylhomoserine sulfhydrylase